MKMLRRLASSIVTQVTSLTVAALLLIVASIALVFQTPAAHIIFPTALSENAASLAELVWLVENSPRELQPFILSAYESTGRRAAIGDEFAAGLQPRPKLVEILLDSNSEVAAQLNGREMGFQTLSALDLQDRLREEGQDRFYVASALQTSIRLADGRVLTVWMAPALSLGERPVGILLGFGSLLAFFVALGVALAYVMLRPIRRLERDAERVELGDVGAGVEESGPVELRRLSAALNRMRRRLAGLIREREQMVAAIAHDVRTGLTRLRLRMDGSDTVSPEELEGDLSQMERLITDMLSYARADSPDGARELVRLEDFTRSVAEGAPHGIDLTVDDALEFEIAADPVALRRMFENLIENARRYGGGEIHLVLEKLEEGLEVRVEDNGPGLPEDELVTVFQPFRRLETSRNRATGGSGLGLGIARAIARAHGAKLRLENRDVGGLAAIVHFPESLRT